MSETERLRLMAWGKSARGHTFRWRILRDLVALLSLRWMTTSEIQDAMSLIQGITHQKTLTMLTELQRTLSVTQLKDEKDGFYKWGATPRGVNSWIGTTAAIPAGIVEVVSIMDSAKK